MTAYRCDEFLSDAGLGLLDLLSGVGTHQHDSVVETELVDLLLGLLQLIAVVLAGDLHVFNNLLGGHSTKARRLNNFHGLERHDHFVGDVVLFTKGLQEIKIEVAIPIYQSLHQDG